MITLTQTKTPGTTANEAVGTTAWSTTDNAKVFDTVYTSATLLGVTGTPKYNSVMLYKGGTRQGSDLTSGANFVAVAQYDTFGSASELWGLSWTRDDINASDFGVGLQVDIRGGNLSQYLKLTNFGFTIPYNGTIIGITVRFNEKKSASINTSVAFIDVADITVTYNLSETKSTKATGTVADDNSVGTQTWANVNNAKVLDGAVASVGGLGGAYYDKTVKLVVTNTVSGNNKASGTDPTTAITLKQYLHSYDEPNYTYDDANFNYDSYYDTWGLTLKGSDVNDSTFGLVFAVGLSSNVSHYLKCTNFTFNLHGAANVLGVTADVYRSRSADTLTANVDFVQMTVYYQDSNLSNVSTMTNISTLTF